MIDLLWQQAYAQSFWELIAVGLGLSYVILAAKESVWCWPAAFVSTGIYTLLFWFGELPMQALLNLFYLAMAVYGYLLWRPQQTDKALISIQRWPWRYHVALLSLGVLLTFSIGGYLKLIGGTQLPYLDAGITVFSILNTFLMARKVLENWLYWLLIDSAAILLYLQTGYHLTALMFLLFLFLALYGFFQWRTNFILNTAHSEQSVGKV